jgi:hypothetical protein
MPDERAVKILFKTYWGPNGWKSGRRTPPADFAYAKQHRVMFDDVRVGHDGVMAWLGRALAAVRREDVAAGFLASLTSRRLDLRSALGSYAVAVNMPEHSFAARGACGECGQCGTVDREDLSGLNFERLKCGGVRHGQPLYQALDLELFAEAERPAPTDADRAALRSVLDAAAGLPVKARALKLVKATGGIVPGNDLERRVVVEVLAMCGVLGSTRTPGFFRGWVPDRDRADPPGLESELGYPCNWWRGEDGVDAEAVRWWFPDLGWESPAAGG